MQDLYMKEGNGFILVFSLVSISTFNDLESFHDHIVEVKNSMGEKNYPIVLAGNKCDLESDRKVKQEDIDAFAQARNCTYMETSAKTQKNITEMFEFLTRKLIELSPAKKKSGCSFL